MHNKAGFKDEITLFRQDVRHITVLTVKLDWLNFQERTSLDKLRMHVYT